MIEGYKIIVHRHGEPYINEVTKASQDLLTTRGLEQAGLAGAQYIAVPKETSIVLGSSPAWRAKQTASGIHSGMGRLDLQTPYEVHPLLQGDAMKAAKAKFPIGVDFGEDWIAQMLKASPDPQAVLNAQGDRYLDFLAQRVLANAGKGDVYDINAGHAPCGSLAVAGLANLHTRDVPQLAENYLDAVVFEVNFEPGGQGRLVGALMEDFKGTGRVDITEKLRAKFEKIISDC